MADRTRDLIKANADLSRTLEEVKRLQEQLRRLQKMGSGGTLAGELADDFNNVLSIIQGYAAAIADHPAESARVIEVGEVIVRTVDQVAALVRQLIAIARTSEPKLDPTSRKGLLRTPTKPLNYLFPETLTLAADLDADIPNMMADASQMDQAFLNLSDNAEDALPDGGNLLLWTRTISGAKLRSRFRDAKAEQYVRISVADSLAMEDEIRRRVSQPIISTKEPECGTGHGHSLTDRIAKNQNGFFDVARAPVRGAAFHMYLPIPKQPAALAEVTKTIGEKKTDGRAEPTETPLCVEDEPRQFRLKQSFMIGEEFAFLTARDGAEAVEVYRRFRDEITLVILVLGLAKLNGWEAFQMMKKLNPQLKGILASGCLSPEGES